MCHHIRIYYHCWCPFTTDEILCEGEKHPIHRDVYRLLEKCYHCLPPDGDPVYIDDTHNGKEKWSAEDIEKIERDAELMFSCGCMMDRSMRHRPRGPRDPDDVSFPELWMVLQKCPEHHKPGDEEDWQDLFADESLGLADRNWAKKYRGEGPSLAPLRWCLESYEDSEERSSDQDRFGRTYHPPDFRA